MRPCLGLFLWLVFAITLSALQSARGQGLAVPGTNLCPFSDEDTCQKSQQCSWVTECEPLNGELLYHHLIIEYAQAQARSVLLLSRVDPFTYPLLQILRKVDDYVLVCRRYCMHCSCFQQRSVSERKSHQDLFGRLLLISGELCMQ